jgi:hypothetical protein
VPTSTPHGAVDVSYFTSFYTMEIITSKRNTPRFFERKGMEYTEITSRMKRTTLKPLDHQVNTTLTGHETSDFIPGS